MKRYIDKIKERGEAYTNKVVFTLALLSTLAVVVIWLILAPFFKEVEQPQVQEDSINYQEFLEEAQAQLGELGNSFNDIENQFGFEEIEEQLGEESTETEETISNEQ